MEKLDHLARRGQHRQPGIVLDQQPGKKIGVQPGVILQRVGGGVGGGEAQAEGRIAKGKIEIDEQRLAAGFPGRRDGEVGGERW